MRIHRLAATFAALSFAAFFSRDARADDPGAELEAASHAYSIDLTQKISMKVGETAEFHVAVVPLEGDHVSPDAPVSLTATPLTSDSAPFDLPKLKLGREESKATAAQGVEFSLPVVGKAQGKGELRATLSFYICVAKLCAHQKRVLSIPVQVD